MDGAAATPKMEWEATDLVTAWQSFKQHADFWFAGPLSSKDEAEKCSYLMIWIGDKGRDIYSTWNLSEADRKKLQILLDRFENHVRPKSNKIFSRYKFWKRHQKDTETFEQYFTDLKLLVKDCAYTDQDEMIRDAIVFGVKDSKVREKCINEGSELTLEKAVNFARTSELSRSQLKSMNQDEDKSVNVVNQKKGSQAQAQAIKKSQYNYKKKSNFQPGQQRQGPKKKTMFQCRSCGTKHGPKQCPAYGKQCNKCHKYNHFASVCMTFKQKAKEMNMVDVSDSDESNELFIGMINLVNSIQNDEWIETISINNTDIRFQLDTGAKCNVISRSTFEKTQLEIPMCKPDAPLRSYSGHIINTVGVINLPCVYKENQYNIRFNVVEMETQPVIGAQTCTELGLIKRINSITGESKILSDNIEKEYADLFKGLGCLPGTHCIRVNEEVSPVVHAPRKIPIALKDRVKEELDRMEEIGVIVKQNEPTRWVNSMVTVIKPNGKLRICIDPRDLNQAILREHFPLKTVEEVISDMPNAKVFSLLDAVSGFWQVRLDEQSSLLCTFNSPFGRYRFVRLPFGVKSAPEVFQKVISNMVADIEGAEAIMDDILVWGKDLEEHDSRLKCVLDKAREYNLKLGPGKCKFRQSELTYVGHLLTSEGVKPDPEKIRAVEAMERPTCVKELQTFIGFIQYMSKFMPNISTVSAPLRILLEKNTMWHWGEEQQRSFDHLKSMAVNAPILQYYNPKKPLTLSVDSSSAGLGAVLIQEGKPIAYGSRALTETQKKYPQIEKETLAILFGCHKFHDYVYGREIKVETDHKPLQSIYKKPLLQAPPRLQRLLLALQKYDLNVTYKPGKEMFIADQLSRSYLKETKEQLVPDLQVNDIHLISHLPVAPEMYKRFQEETASDEELKLLQDVVLEGWPQMRSDLPQILYKYWNFRDEISCIDGLLYKSHKLVVPKSLQLEMLDKIHASHLGIVKCTSRAREVLFWIGMSSDIEERVKACGVCSLNQNANAKEPMIMPDIPERPWSKLGVDLFEFQNRHYLLVVDYYAKWPEVLKLDKLTSKNTIDHMKGLFSRYGYPDIVFTDNGPQFSSLEFKLFAKEFSFVHSTSSPRFPQSNGQAERTVQTVKNLIKKSKDPHTALLDYRNTPLDIGLSPAQLFLNRRLKTSLPTSAPLLSPKHINVKEVQDRLKTRQKKYKEYFDKHSHELRPLKIGEPVVMLTGDKWSHAKVVEKHISPRSYIVKTPSGNKFRRNRKHLKPTKYCATTDDIQDSHDLADKVFESPNVNPSVEQNQSDNNQKSSENSKEVIKHSNVTRAGRKVITPKKFKDFEMSK